jgi:hypothetical protein
MSYETSPAQGASGRSLSKNAIVARLARFAGAAPLSLGEIGSGQRPSGTEIRTIAFPGTECAAGATRRAVPRSGPHESRRRRQRRLLPRDSESGARGPPDWGRRDAYAEAHRDDVYDFCGRSSWRLTRPAPTVALLPLDVATD